MRMNKNPDERVYHEAWLDLPVMPLLAGKTAEQAFVTEGACVKSRERQRGSGFPNHTGILVRYHEAADVAVVISHADGITEPRVTWTGTVADYHADWEVD